MARQVVWIKLKINGMIIAVGALVLVLVLAGGGCHDARVDEGIRVRVGFLPPIDESGRPHRSSVDAARLAVDHVNESGGLRVGGRRVPVDLDVEPVGANLDAALPGALRLVTERRVVAIVGPYSMEPARPVMALADAYGVPMVLPSETSAALTRGRSFVFRATFRDAEQGIALGRFARENLAVKRGAVLYDGASANSTAVAKAFRVAFNFLGGEVVVFESASTSTSATDRSEIFRRVRDAEAEVLLLPVARENIVELARQLRNADVQGRFLGSVTWNDLLLSDIGTDAAAILEGSIFVAPWHPRVPGAESQAFVRDFMGLRGEVPTSSEALTYDAFGLLFDAMTRAGSVDPRAIQRSLRRLEAHRGLSGAISYSGSGDPERAVSVLALRDGALVFERSVEPLQAFEPAVPPKTDSASR